MVDKYWDALEWDFLDKGLTALDWVRGLRDWREFYRIKSRLGQGTAYFSAVANDPEVAELLAEQPEERGGSYTPPAEGWTPLVNWMATLDDRLLMIQASVVGAKAHEYTLNPRPEYEVDRVRRKKAVRKLRKVQQQLLPYKQIDIPEED